MANQPICTFEGFKITDNDLNVLTGVGHINDTIINSVLKHFHRHLLNKEQQKKVHIFDTFFTEAIQMGTPDFIQRWLVDIFEKDYLLIPVNLDFHWFLMIVNHPNNVLYADDTTSIHVMDSMGADYKIEKKKDLYSNLFTFLQATLAVYKHRMVTRPWENFPIIPIDVEIQKKSSDCGIHLLMNAEKFLMRKYHASVLCQMPEMSAKRAALIELIRNGN